MPLYALLGRDGPRGRELRKLHRDAHLEKLRPLADRGRVPFAGPLLDERGEPAGSVIVFEAPDRAEAERIAARDPYVVQGIFERYELFETRAVFSGPTTP